MFDEINISDDCLRKVRNMEAKKNKIKNFRLRYAAVALVLIALFATSNVVHMQLPALVLPKTYR